MGGMKTMGFMHIVEYLLNIVFVNYLIKRKWKMRFMFCVNVVRMYEEARKPLNRVLKKQKGKHALLK